MNDLLDDKIQDELTTMRLEAQLKSTNLQIMQDLSLCINNLNNSVKIMQDSIREIRTTVYGE